MKLLGRVREHRALGFGVALLVTLAISSARADHLGDIHFEVKSGSVDFSQGGGTWTSHKEAKTVRAGDTIRTDDTGTVDLFLGKSGSVRLMPNTTLVIDKVSYEATGGDQVVETQLDLKSGRIVGNVPKLSSASKYEVKTPNAVMGIKGTKYDINHSGCVVVIEGTVVVVCVKTDNTTLTRVVNALERFCCEPGVVEPAGREFIADARRNIPGLRRVGLPVSFVPLQPVQPPLSPITPGLLREENFDE